MAEERKLGFYDLQEIRKRCWDEQDKKNESPVFTANEMLEVVDEAQSVRGLIASVQELFGDALPERSTPTRNNSRG